MDSGGGISVRTSSLARHYPSGGNTLVVFDSIDLRVEAGERVALIGESGAGKSTLLHLLGGLERPTKGSIAYDGMEFTTLGDNALCDFRNKEIGFVWQSHHLLPEFTALENVMMPLLIRNEPAGQAQQEARARLEEVGLGERLTHRTGELSGGEQQRVALARALVANPRVLLADEPTGSLDYFTGERIADLFDDLHRKRRFTAVVVTHNLQFARRCDRILQLAKGTLLPFEETGVAERPNAPAGASLRSSGPTGDIASRSDGTHYV